ETNSTFGKAGLDAQQEALRPLILFVLALTSAIVTVEIEVTQLQASLCIFDKSSLDHGRHGQGCSQSGQGHAPGDWGLEHFLFSSLDDALKVALTATLNKTLHYYFSL